MQIYEAKIYDEDQLVVNLVTVYLKEEESPAGIRSWEGAVLLTPEQVLEPGHRYRLTLEDQRSGDFYVRSIARSTQRPTQQVSFVGTGPLE